jgi:hypothetical protein
MPTVNRCVFVSSTDRDEAGNAPTKRGRRAVLDDMRGMVERALMVGDRVEEFATRHGPIREELT